MKHQWNDLGQNHHHQITTTTTSSTANEVGKVQNSPLTHLSTSKGQLISKCPFGVFKSQKKKPEIFFRISALASDKRPNKKCSVKGVEIKFSN